jgi:hypothetical protein
MTSVSASLAQNPHGAEPKSNREHEEPEELNQKIKDPPPLWSFDAILQRVMFVGGIVSFRSFLLAGHL